MLCALLWTPLVYGQVVIAPSPVPVWTNNCVVQYWTSDTQLHCVAISGVSQPLTDSVGLIADSANATKILAFEVSAIANATTRTWTIPNANITIPTTIASLAANTFTGLQTANGGIAGTTGTFSSTVDITGKLTLSATNNAVGTVTSGVWNAGAVTSSGGIAGTTGTFSSTLGVSGNTTLYIPNAAGAFVPLKLSMAPGGVTGSQAIELGLYDGDYGASIRAAYNYNSAISATLIFATSTTAGTKTDALTVGATQLVRMHAYGAGTATFDASGNITSVSDERMKVILGPFTPGLNALLGLRPILHRYTEASGLDTENVYASFSAQNVMGYIPEAVGKNLDGRYSINIVPIVAATVTAVQELSREVDELRAAANLPARNRVVAKVTDEKRIVNSATPKRLAEIAKQNAKKAKEIIR
jgi:hypothetical protein